MDDAEATALHRRRIERTLDLEVLVLEALADLVTAPRSTQPEAMDDCAARIVGFVELAGVQRRGLCERLAEVRRFARVPQQQHGERRA